MAAGKGVSIRDLYGGRFLSRAAARRSLIRLEDRLRADFKERRRLRVQRAELMRKCSTPLRDLMSTNRSVAEAVREMRRLSVAASRRKMQHPRTAKIGTGIFPGGVGFSATVGPPYDCDWTWNAVDGKGRVDVDTANKNSGKMAFDIETDDNTDLVVTCLQLSLGYCVLAGSSTRRWMDWPIRPEFRPRR
jgi:hypothetical protein